MLAHFGAMLGLCWPSCGLCMLEPGSPILGLCWAMLAQLQSMLGLCWPIWGLCWGYVDSPEVILGLCCVHEFTFIPKICLKKLSPAACEAPIPFLQHHFSEKAESCLGRAHPRWAPEGSRQWPARFQVTLPKGSAVPRDPPLAKLDLLQWRSPQSPPSFTLRTFSLPPVACESHRPPKRGRRHKVGPS